MSVTSISYATKRVSAKQLASSRVEVRPEDRERLDVLAADAAGDDLGLDRRRPGRRGGREAEAEVEGAQVAERDTPDGALGPGMVQKRRDHEAGDATAAGELRGPDAA